MSGLILKKYFITLTLCPLIVNWILRRYRFILHQEDNVIYLHPCMLDVVIKGKLRKLNIRTTFKKQSKTGLSSY